MADVLGGLARIEYARIENTPTSDATPDDVWRQVEDRLTLALPSLLGLGFLGQSRLSERIASATIDGAFDLLAKRVTGDGNTARPRPEVPIVATLADENVARGMLELAPITTPPKPDPIMAELAAIREMIGGQKSPQDPLFSVAARRFITGRVETYGDPSHPEIGYLRHRSSVFLALVGDKPVDAYDRADLQHFFNELSWLPPFGMAFPRCVVLVEHGIELYDAARPILAIGFADVGMGDPPMVRCISLAHSSRGVNSISKTVSSPGSRSRGRHRSRSGRYDGPVRVLDNTR